MQDYQQQQSTTVTLKLKNGDDIRRIRLDNPEKVSFEELQQIIGKLYPDISMAAVVLKYTDDEGDSLSVTSTLEWKEAVRPFLNAEKIGVLTLTFHYSNPSPKSDESTKEARNEEESSEDLPTLEDLEKLVVGALKVFGLDGEVEVTCEPPPRSAFPCGGPAVPPPFIPHPFAHPLHAQHHPGGIPFCAPPRRSGGCHAARAGPRCRSRCPAATRNDNREDNRSCNSDATPTCTFAKTGQRYASHRNWYNCLTCGLVGAEGCCDPCARRCHQGHDLLPRGGSPAFFCDCGAGAKGLQCRSLPVPRDNKEKEVPTGHEELMGMKVSELKAVLEDRGISYADCVDKVHLVEKIRASTPTPTPPATPPSSPAASVVLPQSEAAVAAEEVREETKEVNEEDKVEVETVAEDKKEEEHVDEKEEEKGTSGEPARQLSPFAQNLAFLHSMGFDNRDLNIDVLIRHQGNLNGAVAELVNM